MANVFGGTPNTGVGTSQVGGTSSSNNQILVASAREALENLKLQTAAELGIQNYAQTYKGDLPSRVNGSVGGFMVKKMIAFAESQLSGGGVSGSTVTGTSVTGTTTPVQ